MGIYQRSQERVIERICIEVCTVLRLNMHESQYSAQRLLANLPPRGINLADHI